MVPTDRLMGGAQKSSLPPRKMVDSPIQSVPERQTLATIPVRPIIINRSAPAMPPPMMGGQAPVPPMGMPPMPMKPPMGGQAPAPASPMPMQPPMSPGMPPQAPSGQPPMNTPMPVMPQPGGGGNDFFMQQLMMAAQQGRNGGM